MKRIVFVKKKRRYFGAGQRVAATVYTVISVEKIEKNEKKETSNQCELTSSRLASTATSNRCSNDVHILMHTTISPNTVPCKSNIPSTSQLFVALSENKKNFFFFKNCETKTKNGKKINKQTNNNKRKEITIIRTFFLSVFFCDVRSPDVMPAFAKTASEFSIHLSTNFSLFHLKRTILNNNKKKEKKANRGVCVFSYSYARSNIAAIVSLFRLHNSCTDLMSAFDSVRICDSSRTSYDFAISVYETNTITLS